MEHHGLFAPMDFWMEVSSEKIKDLNGIFSSHAWLARQFAAIEKIMGRSWEYKHPPVVSSAFALWWDLDQFSFFGRWWHRALKGRNMCGTCLATSAVHCGLTPKEGVKVEVSMINIASCQFPRVSELHGISINFPGISKVRYSSWIYMVIWVIPPGESHLRRIAGSRLSSASPGHHGEAPPTSWNHFLNFPWGLDALH